VLAIGIIFPGKVFERLHLEQHFSFHIERQLVHSLGQHDRPASERATKVVVHHANALRLSNV
jgi:hypothetical protein